ncbi:FMN-binding protein [Saccharicrinis aurantiacus]|uniref:FMN-binding protein n=1 Tax=Saccharicrinis aurantiacus TaxID=1849719 RepID=UPI000838881A|nr:FMN-binding protein [Saccharicrinis aurantiacus]
MRKTTLSKKILQSITIVLILLAIALRLGGAREWFAPSKERQLEITDIQNVFPNASSYRLKSDKSIEVRSDKSERIGTILSSVIYETSQLGYNDVLPILIGLDLDHKVKAIAVLDNSETGEFMSHVYDSNLLSKWDGKQVDTTLIQRKVDAISGATYSSEAIIKGVNATLSTYLSIEQSHQLNWLRITQLVLVFILMLCSLIMVFTKRFKNYYFYYLLAVLLVFGFFTNKMLSLSIFETWLQNGLPWYTNVELILILVASIIMTFIGKHKYYCNYLCPMGALQMIVSKLSPFKKRKFVKKVFNIDLRLIYLCFIWASILMGISLPLSSMEPFLAFAYSVSGWLMIGAGMLIIIVSLFFNRPWCALCPTGCALDSIPSFKQKK